VANGEKGGREERRGEVVSSREWRDGLERAGRARANDFDLTVDTSKRSQMISLRNEEELLRKTKEEKGRGRGRRREGR